jgi:SAM-dependent methyltransferase
MTTQSTSPILSEQERAKRDPRSDTAFYDTPRFVTHADDGFLTQLTETYSSVLSSDDRIFDAMSSWVSHLPDNVSYDHIIGHGLNAAELRENEALDEWFCQNLNQNQVLPLEDNAVDAVTCALSVQYLQYPGRIFDEFTRVLNDDGVAIISFTNRMFPTKAVRAWRAGSMDERHDLVEQYCAVSGLTTTQRISRRPESDPFRATIARN